MLAAESEEVSYRKILSCESWSSLENSVFGEPHPSACGYCFLTPDCLLEYSSALAFLIWLD